MKGEDLAGPFFQRVDNMQAHEPGDQRRQIDLAKDRLDNGKGSREGTEGKDITVPHGGQRDEAEVHEQRKSFPCTGGIYSRPWLKRSRLKALYGRKEQSPRDSDQQVDAYGTTDLVGRDLLASHDIREHDTCCHDEERDGQTIGHQRQGIVLEKMPRPPCGKDGEEEKQGNGEDPFPSADGVYRRERHSGDGGVRNNTPNDRLSEKWIEQQDE